MEKGLWAAILLQLQEELSPAIYRTWFSKCQLGEVTELDSKTNQIQIVCNNNFSREQLEKKYYPLLCRTVNEKTGKNNILVFKVGTQVKKTKIENFGLFGFEGEKKEKVKISPFFKNFTFENLVVGTGNRLAVSAAEAVIQSLGATYNPLFFFGQSGIGKTHLLHAIANCLQDKNSDLQIVYLTGEHFTNSFIEALRSKQIKKFREDLRALDLLLVDDIQFLAAKENTQEEFFHTFNELYLASKQIILTSDKHPSKIGGLEERLVSRFLGGLTVEIKSPDLEMKMRLIEKKTKAIGLALPRAAALYVAQKTNGSVRELEGALFKIFSSAKTLDQPPSMKLVREVVFQDDVKVKISPRLVLSVIQNHYKLKAQDLISSSRKKEVLFPRQVAMYFLRELASLSLDSIGKTFGNRDHSTVIHAIDKVRLLVEKDLQVEKTINTLRAKLLD